MQRHTRVRLLLIARLSSCDDERDDDEGRGESDRGNLGTSEKRERRRADVK